MSIALPFRSSPFCFLRIHSSFLKHVRTVCQQAVVHDATRRVAWFTRQSCSVQQICQHGRGVESYPSEALPPTVQSANSAQVLPHRSGSTTPLNLQYFPAPYLLRDGSIECLVAKTCLKGRLLNVELCSQSFPCIPPSPFFAFLLSSMSGFPATR